MENEEMSEILQKIANMMNQTNQDNKNSSQQNTSSDETNANFLQDFLSNINSFQNNENQENNHFDFETILKMKTILDSFQSAQNSPEANLLLSLKPYLNNSRKQKLDQYIQFLNLSKILDTWNKTNGGANES